MSDSTQFKLRGGLQLSARFTQQIAAALGNRSTAPQLVEDSGDSKNPRIKVAAKEDRTEDGITFDSKWEMNCYSRLKMLGSSRVKLQPVFELQPAFTAQSGRKFRGITYTADFLVDDCVVIDAKGMLTEKFILTEKLFVFRHTTEIVKVKSFGELIELIQTLREPQTGKKLTCKRFMSLPSKPKKMESAC